VHGDEQVGWGGRPRPGTTAPLDPASARCTEVAGTSHGLLSLGDQAGW